jgi:hypothetical protein
MKNEQRRRVVTAVLIVLAVLLVMQLQPLVIRALKGGDGSFGYRPLSDDCLGWVGTAVSITWLPFGDFQFQLGYFKYQYYFTEEGVDADTLMCLGQDIVFGE